MKYLFISLVLLAVGCKPAGITCDVSIRNESKQTFDKCLVDCGRGPLDIGILVPDSERSFFGMVGVEGTPVNVQWRIEGTSILHQRTNVLGRGLKRGDDIYLVFDENGPKLTKHP